MVKANLASGRAVEILLVEDSPGDARLAQEVFKGCDVRNHLRIVEDGEEALAYLRRGQEGGVRLPDVILLDLKLPKKGGREVLAEIKADGKLRRIPVVVLTASSAEEDIAGAYDLNANCYITKPMDLNGFVRVVNGIVDFWLTMVKLPRE